MVIHGNVWQHIALCVFFSALFFSIWSVFFVWYASGNQRIISSIYLWGQLAGYLRRKFRSNFFYYCLVNYRFRACSNSYHFLLYIFLVHCESSKCTVTEISKSYSRHFVSTRIHGKSLNKCWSSKHSQQHIRISVVMDLVQRSSTVALLLILPAGV